MGKGYKPIEYYVNENGCHICTNHSKIKGYCQTKRDGFRLLHRWIYWKATGERPEVVRHICNNKACINPEHLKGGTQADNINDKYLNGAFSHKRSTINPFH